MIFSQFTAGGITLCRLQYVGQYLWFEPGLVTERRKVLENFRASSEQARPSSTSHGEMQPLRLCVWAQSQCVYAPNWNSLNIKLQDTTTAKCRNEIL